MEAWKIGEAVLGVLWIAFLGLLAYMEYTDYVDRKKEEQAKRDKEQRLLDIGEKYKAGTHVMLADSPFFEPDVRGVPGVSLGPTCGGLRIDLVAGGTWTTVPAALADQYLTVITDDGKGLM